MNFYLIDKINNDLNSVLKMHLLFKLEIEHIPEVPDLKKEKEVFLKMFKNAEEIIVI
jgi:hypothetical protein